MSISAVELIAFKDQLGNYIVDVHGDERLADLNGIGKLSQSIVETKKHSIFPLVHLLLNLALILLVATTVVE